MESQRPDALIKDERAVELVCGSLLYFSGMAFLLWARLTLGKYYFASTVARAQLFADHQLVKTGPYAMVRHRIEAVGDRCSSFATDYRRVTIG